MANQPDTSDDKDEGAASRFIEAMRRLVRVTKPEVEYQDRLRQPIIKRKRSAPPKGRVD